MLHRIMRNAAWPDSSAEHDRYPELSALRDYRRAHSLTYRELAARVGIAYRTVYGLLNDAYPRPYAATLATVRAFLVAEARRLDRKRRAARRAVGL